MGNKFAKILFMLIEEVIGFRYKYLVPIPTIDNINPDDILAELEFDEIDGYVIVMRANDNESLILVHVRYGEYLPYLMTNNVEVNYGQTTDRNTAN